MRGRGAVLTPVGAGACGGPPNFSGIFSTLGACSVYLRGTAASRPAPRPPPDLNRAMTTSRKPSAVIAARLNNTLERTEAAIKGLLERMDEAKTLGTYHLLQWMHNHARELNLELQMKLAMEAWTRELAQGAAMTNNAEFDRLLFAWERRMNRLIETSDESTDKGMEEILTARKLIAMLDLDLA